MKHLNWMIGGLMLLMVGLRVGVDLLEKPAREAPAAAPSASPSPAPSPNYSDDVWRQATLQFLRPLPQCSGIFDTKEKCEGVLLEIEELKRQNSKRTGRLKKEVDSWLEWAEGRARAAALEAAERERARELARSFK